MRIADILTKMLVAFFVVLYAAPAKEEPSTSKIPHIEKVANKTADSGVVPFGTKILNVKKIIGIKKSGFAVEEVKRYLSNGVPGNGTLSTKMNCEETDRNNVRTWLSPKMVKAFKYQSDTGTLIYNFPRKFNGSDLSGIGVYYVNANGVKSDSLIFIGHHWVCPDYKVFLVDMDFYQFLNDKSRVNYLGNNFGNAATSFTLKPCYWDKAEKRYTQQTPVVSVNDSTSLLIYSVSGVKISHEAVSAVEPTDLEKRLIFGNLFSGIPNVSCFGKITLEKLSTVGNVSRFFGQISNGGMGLNCWYIADIEEEQCNITILEMKETRVDSKFYCAYSFGKGNLPDVYVCVGASENSRIEGKDIYYKSNNYWVVTNTQKEYTGDCFTEIDE
jgi:hypothetical protein